MQYRSLLKPLFVIVLLATVMAVPRFTNHAATGGTASQDVVPEKPVTLEATDPIPNGYVIQLDAQGNRYCRDILPTEQKTLLSRASSAKLHVIPSIRPNQSGGLRIILRGTDQLERFPEAKAAFQAAAAKWESIITSPITVVIDVDFGPNRFGTPYPPRVLGSTATQTLITAEGGYAGVRRALIAQATGEAETALVNALPATAVPTDLGNSTRVQGTSAQLRALGALPAVADPGNEPANFGPPPSVGFNSNNAFDFDPNNGIDPDKFDFDATAVHEIGHALGFVSSVGTQELSPNAAVSPSIWDLFRFRPGVGLGDLAAAPRVQRTGGLQNFFTYTGAQIPLSTGNPAGNNGDRSQSSHWRERGLNGQFIGIMDPNGAPGDRDVLTNNDVLAVDTFGYTVNNPFTPPDTIPPTVTNVTPTGGEAFNVGDRITITWTSSDNAGVFSHAINLSRDGGQTFPISVATGIAGSAQTFAWTAPFGTDGTRLRLRVTALDRSYLGASAASSGDFTIQAIQGNGPAPTDLTATASANNVNLTWQAPPTPANATDAKLAGITKLHQVTNRAITRQPVVAETLVTKTRRKAVKSLETTKTIGNLAVGIQPNQNDIPLTSGTAVRGSIEAPGPGGGVLAATQFTIEVPAGATQLKVDLDGGAADTDMFLRFGQRVTLAGGRVQADAGATGDTGQESITLNASSTPALRTGGTYFIAVANFGPGVANFSLTATVTTGSQPPPPPTGDTVALTSGTPTQGSIAAPTQGGGGVLGATQYTIQVPANASQVRIDLNGNPQDVDLFARFGQRVDIANGRVQADAGSTGNTGTESIVLTPTSSPALRAGTYFIAVANFGPGVSNFTLTATVSTGGTQPPPPSGDTVVLTSGTPATGTAAAPGSAGFLLHPTQYTIAVPAGTTSLRVDLRGTPVSTDIDLYVRFGERVAIQGGDLFADFTSEGLDGNETVTIDLSTTPALRAGTYFIAINNFGPSVSNFTVTATTGNQPAGPRVTGYNVYRSTTSPVAVNGDNRIATVAATTTRFSDSPTPANGQARYNYVVTAIYDNAVESGPSNEASATPGNSGGGSGGDTVALTSGRPQTGTIASPPPNTVLLSGTQYTIAVPAGATRLQVQLTGNTDVDLYVRFGNRIDVAEGEIVADFISESEDSSETITISPTTSPALRAGTYFIGVGNFGPGQANFTLTATVTTSGGRDPDATAPTVRMVSPNGGERVRAGSPLTVQWSATDNIGVVSQDVLLSTDGGATFPTRLATGLAGNVSSFVYAIPANQARVRAARVRVVARDEAGNSATAASAADFRIRPARN